MAALCGPEESGSDALRGTSAVAALGCGGLQHQEILCVGQAMWLVEGSRKFEHPPPPQAGSLENPKQANVNIL